MVSWRTGILAAACVALGVGLGVSGAGHQAHMSGRGEAVPLSPPASAAKKILYYRNPMGLADTSPVPKKDAMGMDYIPVYAAEIEAGAGTVVLGPERVQKLGVTTAVAEKRVMALPVRATGIVTIDEKRQTIVAPRFDGWVGKMFVNATGQQVKKGDPLFAFYSPEVVQVESDALVSGLSEGKELAGPALKRLWSFGLPDEEIQRLKRDKEVLDHVILRAPADATVIDKQVIEGQKFSAGAPLYTLVDLTQVWVIADVSEQEIDKIAVGQPASVTLDAATGVSVEGKVDFISPTVAPDTRTAKVRIEVPNPKGILKINRFAHVTITASPAAPVLTIPTDAVIDSGTRKTVLVVRGEGHFQPKQVTTGIEADGTTEILSGLGEGDRVVTRAAFLIDAESNSRVALDRFMSTEKNHD